MRRSLFLLAFFSLCANGTHARVAPAGAADDEADKPKTANAKPRRVLFRTDASRLVFQPAPARTVEMKPVRINPTEAREPGAKPVSYRIERYELRPIAPAPKTKKRTLRPPAPELAVERTEPVRRADLDLQPTSFTPYDAYMGSVRAVLNGLDQHEANMASACALVRAGRQFRYVATDPYRAQTPEVTEERQAGDCKSKALWLYDHLGDSSALYVIGKLDRRSRTSHAWVYWPYAGRWWILDPTDRVSPIAADSVSANRYVPYYSYSRAGSFRHKATSLMLAMNAPIPAAASAVAVRARSVDANASRR